MSYSDLSIKKRDTASPTPCCTITQHARIEGDSVAAKKLGAFTGEVWLDPILSASDTFIGLVNFLPGARTNWHRHDKGQVLRVLGGAGWYCDQGEKPRRIAAGDVIWCPPGVVHWHGADDGSYMVHEATSLGKVDWYEAVSDEDKAVWDEPGIDAATPDPPASLRSDLFVADEFSQIGAQVVPITSQFNNVGRMRDIRGASKNSTRLCFVTSYRVSVRHQHKWSFACYKLNNLQNPAIVDVEPDASQPK